MEERTWGGRVWLLFPGHARKGIRGFLGPTHHPRCSQPSLSMSLSCFLLRQGRIGQRSINQTLWVHNVKRAHGNGDLEWRNVHNDSGWMQDDGGLSSACNGHGGSYTDAVPEHGGLVVTLVTSTFPTNTSLPALSSSSTGPPFFLIGDAIDMGWGGDARG